MHYFLYKKLLILMFVYALVLFQRLHYINEMVHKAENIGFFLIIDRFVLDTLASVVVFVLHNKIEVIGSSVEMKIYNVCS